jgi:hypothetical protein
METVKTGLGMYAYMQTFSMIFVGVLLLAIGIFLLYQVINNNYKKSPSSKVDYYTITNLTECNQDEINNNLCKLQLVYSDGTTIYKNNVDPVKTKVGDTSVFYAEKNPKSYIVTPSPYIFPGGFSCFACIIFITAIIRLIIIRSSKEAAAVVGGMDAVSTTTNMIANSLYPTSYNRF